jgi:hypothetical protein
VGGWLALAGGGSEEALAQRVLSSGSTTMPPGWLTWLVAGVFAGSAAAVSATAVGAGGRRARRATWATAGVFAGRGVLGPIQDAFTGLGTYERLDLAIYSPLCLAIAAGAAAVAWRDGGRTTPTGTPPGYREPAPRRPTANAVSVSSP